MLFLCLHNMSTSYGSNCYFSLFSKFSDVLFVFGHFREGRKMSRMIFHDPILHSFFGINFFVYPTKIKIPRNVQDCIMSKTQISTQKPCNLGFGVVCTIRVCNYAVNIPNHHIMHPLHSINTVFAIYRYLTLHICSQSRREMSGILDS